MEFDYFYGPEDAEQYQFYRIPKLLITSDQFKDVSVEAKLLYGLMLPSGNDAANVLGEGCIRSRCLSRCGV